MTRHPGPYGERAGARSSSTRVSRYFDKHRTVASYDVNVTKRRGLAVGATGCLFVLATLLVVSACGGSSHAKAHTRVVVMPHEGPFPAVTETVSATSPDSPACKQDAADFAHRATRFVSHYGATAYPVDVEYELLHHVLIDFQSRGCDPRVLGESLDRHLSRRQRAFLLRNLPAAEAAFVRGASEKRG